ncbi:hypothetical protein [Mycolicibacterium thermoresistibile]
MTGANLTGANLTGPRTPCTPCPAICIKVNVIVNLRHRIFNDTTVVAHDRLPEQRLHQTRTE